MLAIIIPAYKISFFEEALASIAAQTDRRFHVYIGDDASPANLYGIVKEFENKIPITYVRFDSNFGGSSLVKHWHRCIAMSQKEEWIWLFSDDDVMEADCVSAFYKQIELTSSNYDLYKFGVRVIDKDGHIIRTQQANKFLDAAAFLKKRLASQLDSFIVEYVFKREKFLAVGKIPDFPMAWASDDAFWILMSMEKGICGIPHAFVNWRYSGSNISSDNKNWKSKIIAACMFLKTIARRTNLMAGSKKMYFNWLLGQYYFHCKKKTIGTDFFFYNQLSATDKLQFIISKTAKFLRKVKWVFLK